MTTTPDTFHWRKPTPDERADIALWCIERGHPGMMFVETQNGEHVLMVLAKVETKPDMAVSDERAD